MTDTRCKIQKVLNGTRKGAEMIAISCHTLHIAELTLLYAILTLTELLTATCCNMHMKWARAAHLTRTTDKLTMDILIVLVLRLQQSVVLPKQETRSRMRRFLQFAHFSSSYWNCIRWRKAHLRNMPAMQMRKAMMFHIQQLSPCHKCALYNRSFAICQAAHALEVNSIWGGNVQ